MHKLYDLKDKLIGELEDYSENGKYSKEDVEAIKYMASAVDHICNICEGAEDEYSNRGTSYDDGRGYSRRYSRNDGTSMARGRMNARRDTMGRYSRADGPQDGAIEDIKQDVQRLMDKIEKM